MIGIGMTGALAAALSLPAPSPNLPYLKNPSDSYRECVAAVSNGQARPRIKSIGAGPCRSARAVLWRAIRYHVTLNWSSIASSRAESARIQAQIDDSARSILGAYEADLQHWLEAARDKVDPSGQ